MVEDCEVAVVKVKWDFHGFHHLANEKITSSKLVNRRDALNLLRISINQYNKNKLKSTKINVNESLYPYYCKLLGKCNSLLKRNLLKSLNTINGKLKIKYDLDSGEVSVVITHEEDLLEIFGSGMMSRVESKHNPQWWVIIMVAISIFKFIFIFI